jgi:hypothetical protein
MEQRFKFTIFTNFPLIRGFFGSSGAGVGSVVVVVSLSLS